jgi:hypothetical protein
MMAMNRRLSSLIYVDVLDNGTSAKLLLSQRKDARELKEH